MIPGGLLLAQAILYTRAHAMPSPSPRPPIHALRIKKSASGFGLFAEHPIPSGVFLAEYWGEVVATEKADEIGGRYLFDLENGKTILGGTRKNIARYANHGCKPNAEVRIKGNRVFLYSIKRIKAGEEITWDYGEEYFDFYIKPHGCRCVGCHSSRL